MKTIQKYMEDLADVPKTVKNDVKNTLMNPQISYREIYYPEMSVTHALHPALETLEPLSPEWENRVMEYMDASKIFGMHRNPEKAVKNALSYIQGYAVRMESSAMEKTGGFRPGNMDALRKLVYGNMLVIHVFSRIYELAKFNIHGRRVLKITDPELKERLSVTDFKNIRMSHLHIPFESFYIDVGIKEKALYDDATPRKKYEGYTEKSFNGKVEMELEGIVVSRYPDGYGFVCIHNTSIHGDVMDEYGRSVKKIQRSVAFPIAHYAPKTDDDMENVAKYLRNLSTTIFPGSPEFAEVSERIFKKGVSLAINTIIYASHVNKKTKEKLYDEKPPKDLPASPFPASRKTAQKNSGKYYYTFLKASSESKRTWKKENEKVSEFKRNGGKPFLVRGHWRNQPYGSRENPEYKLKWIEPYWKNLAPEKENNVAEPDSEEKYRIYTMR